MIEIIDIEDMAKKIKIDDFIDQLNLLKNNGFNEISFGRCFDANGLREKELVIFGHKTK